MDDKKVKLGDLPGNQKTVNINKDQKEKKLQKVVKGNVVKQKKSLTKRIVSSMVGEDVSSVSQYIIQDVIVPAAKNTIADMVTGGIEMLLFGEIKGSKTKRRGGQSYVSYNSYYGRDDRRDPRSSSHKRAPRSRTSHIFDDIVLETRGEAEEVVSLLVELTDTYGMATVADLYDLVGITSEFTDTKYGWETLGGATVDRTRNGYLLNLPRTIQLD